MINTAATIGFWTKAGAGAAGAALWIIFVHGIPLARRAVAGKVQWTPTRQRVLGLIGLIASYLVLGSAAPFVMDPNNAKEALAWGLAWQGVFGQFVK